MNNFQKISRLYYKGLQLQKSGRIGTLIRSNDSPVSSNNIASFQSTRPMSLYQETEANKDSLVKRIIKSIPFIGITDNKMKLIAFQHFEKMVDETDYMKFFEELDLPDTFYSWFIVTELHLWMLSTRAMAEGKEGRILRNNLVGALWTDVSQRVKKLIPGSSSESRKKIAELSEQLQATFIAYDEGYMSNDVVFAGALWRRFYQQDDVDLEQLQILISYIRKNMRILETLTCEEFYNTENIKWSPLPTLHS